ncbi:protein phosphatase 1F [Ornithorhynchus anatinus]|uniref:protein phosphatase 1F n=1 Tax=Ornithorhynchus anatinus TaxID=9258 RepID=UPI0010A832C8|nr:protein phosphatase 1F [Ornithorhynchus anatinus]
MTGERDAQRYPETEENTPSVARNVPQRGYFSRTLPHGQMCYGARRRLAGVRRVRRAARGTGWERPAAPRRVADPGGRSTGCRPAEASASVAGPDEGPPGPDPDGRVLPEAGPLQARFLRDLWEACAAGGGPGPRQPPRPPGRPPPISVHAIRNSRRKMEDRHVTLPAFNRLFGFPDEPERAYFAVFDGTRGADAADFAAAQLHVHLARHPELGTDPARALRAAFRLTDDAFLRKAERESLRSGSTGVCALLAGPAVHVAWLGDSQAVLVQRGEALTLVEPHKPERQDEKERIEALGGFVSYVDCWRVNGTLAVSRAIGDASQKPYVSGEADSATRELSGSEDYLLLACDGFFDAVRPQEAAELVLRHLTASGGAEAGVAEALVSAAREGGSGDNITVLVVFLRDPRDVLAGGEPGDAPGVSPGPSPPGPPDGRGA